jgi:hypothetical protein
LFPPKPPSTQTSQLYHHCSISSLPSCASSLTWTMYATVLLRYIRIFSTMCEFQDNLLKYRVDLRPFSLCGTEVFHFQLFIKDHRSSIKWRNRTQESFTPKIIMLISPVRARRISTSVYVFIYVDSSSGTCQRSNHRLSRNLSTSSVIMSFSTSAPMAVLHKVNCKRKSIIGSPH